MTKEYASSTHIHIHIDTWRINWKTTIRIIVRSLSRGWLRDPMHCSTPGFPVHCHLLELAQTHVHWVSDANQPSCPLSSPSPPAFNLSQPQGLFQWVSSSHQVARVCFLHFHKLSNLIYQFYFMRPASHWYWSHTKICVELQLCSVQFLTHVWLFVTPWTEAHQASLSFTNSWSLLKLMSIESVMPSNHLILSSCPLLLLPSIFLSLRVFSNESVLRNRWPKYWSFSFRSSPSNEYSGLISFRIDRLDLLAGNSVP